LDNLSGELALEADAPTDASAEMRGAVAVEAADNGLADELGRNDEDAEKT